MNSMEQIITQEVEKRFNYESMDDVSDTRSYANMEQTLRKEYHRRFLIELIQNACDLILLPTNSVLLKEVNKLTVETDTSEITISYMKFRQ